MSARDELYELLGGVPTPAVIRDYKLDAYRAEVVAERDAMTVAWLVKKAREFRAMGGRMRAAQADAVAAMASKIDRGAVRPDNLRTLPADFFEPGHTYQRRRWQFQCLAVAPAPHDGQLRAVGFLDRPGETATVHGMGREHWEHDGWTDVTEGGDR